MEKKYLQAKQLTEMDKNMYLQNIQTAHAAQYQKKTNKAVKNMGGK